MPNSSKNGLLNYWVSAQWNIMHPLIIILMTMEHRGDAYSRKKQCKTMHELWLQVIFKCLRVDRVNIWKLK